MRRIEQLTGARGRRIFYRAQRYKAETVFSRVRPSVRLDGREVALHDLSMSGIAVLARDTAGWTEGGEALLPLHIRLGDASVYEGEARLCRIEPSPRGAKLALELCGGYLDIQDLADRHRDLALHQTFDSILPTATNMVEPEYRRLCADVLYLLRQCRGVLGDGEAPVNGAGQAGNGRYGGFASFGAIGNGSGNGADNALLEHCIERALPEWEALWRRGNELVAPIMADREVVQATKRFTEAVLTPEFLPGPIWSRGYGKPLGYPGDYELMKQVYAWQLAGAGAYGGLAHRLGLEVAECIATRMEMALEAIAATVGANGTDEPARVMTLGCGPAEEIARYLRIEHLPRRVAFTLIDQEHAALAHAYERIYPETVRHRGGAAIRCLHASFTQMMKADELIGEIPRQDLVYTMGLVDYLTDRRARELVGALYRRLAPGGLLVVGNMKDTPIGNLWPLEFVSDWSLNYRTDTQMRDMASGLDPAALTIEEDPTGRVYIMYLRAP